MNDEEIKKTNPLIWTLTAVILFWVSIPLIFSWIVSFYFIKSFFYSKNKKILLFFLSIFCIFLTTTFLVFSILNFVYLEIYKINFFDIKSRYSIGSNLAINIVSLSPWIFLLGVIIFSSGHFLFRKKIVNYQKIQYLKRKQLLENESLNKSYFKTKYKFSKNLFFIFSYEKYLDLKNKLDDKLTNGVSLNKNVLIPEIALKQPISVIGATGYGKTNTLFHFLTYGLNKKLPIIFIDGKGDDNLVKNLFEICKKNNLRMKTWTIENNLGQEWNETSYNPFKNKSNNQIISLLMEMQGYSDILRNQTDATFYRQIEKAILDLIVPLLVLLEIPIDFNSLSKYCDKNTFKTLISAPSNFNKLSKTTTNFNELNKIKVNLQQDIESIESRHWVSLKLKLSSFAKSLKNISSDGFGIQDIMKRENNISLFYFSIATLDDLTNSKAIADIIIQDLMLNARFNKSQGQTIIIMDEYSSWGTAALSTLILQSRAFLYTLILGYQGIGDLDSMGYQFKNTILNNCNTFIVHKLQEPAGAEEISKIFGTKKSIITTYQYAENDEELNLTNVGTHRVGDQFLFNPNIIKKLNVGQAVIKTIDNNSKTLIYPNVEIIDLISEKYQIK